jgi:hypothetical protein
VNYAKNTADTAEIKTVIAKPPLFLKCWYIIAIMLAINTSFTALGVETSQSGDYSADEIVQALRIRESKLAKSAIQVSITRETHSGQTHVNGILAVSDKCFLVQAKTFLRDNLLEKWYGSSFNGQHKYNLVNDVKEVSEGYNNRQYHDHIAKIIANPATLLARNIYEDNRGSELFNKTDILSIHHLSTGNILVETDGTKASDFERIVYEFVPSKDWAICKVEMWSGDKLVVLCEANQFIPLPESGISIPSSWKYERSQVEKHNLTTTINAILKIEAIPRFNFDNPESFQLIFPDTAIDRETAKSRGLQEAKKNLRYLTGAHNVDKMISEIADAELSNSDFLKTTASSSNKSKLNSSLAIEQYKAEKKPAEQVVENIEKVKEKQIFSWHRTMITTLSLCLACLVAFSIAIALRVAKSGQNKTVMITKNFVYVSVLVVAVLVITLFTLAAPKSRPIGSTEENALQWETTPGTHSSTMDWPEEFGWRDCEGVVYKDGAAISFNCKLQRSNGIETHEWWISGIKNRLVVEKETARLYFGKEVSPTKTFWAPSIYSILVAHGRHSGQEVNIFGVHSKEKIKLNFISLLDHQLQQRIADLSFEIEYSDNTWIATLKTGDKNLVVLTLTPLTGKYQISEDYKYYNEQGQIYYRFGVRY